MVIIWYHYSSLLMAFSVLPDNQTGFSMNKKLTVIRNKIGGHFQSSKKIPESRNWTRTTVVVRNAGCASSRYTLNFF